MQAPRLPVLRTRVLSAIEGIHLDFDQSLKAMPMRDEHDARNVLAHMKAFAARVQQDIALLREGKLLDHGAVPLPVLESLVDERIATQKARCHVRHGKTGAAPRTERANVRPIIAEPPHVRPRVQSRSDFIA